MAAEDVVQVEAIEQESFFEPWTADFFRDFLEAGYHCWVYERCGAVEAYAVMSINGRVAHILNICVRQSCRRQGLGRTLIEQLLLIARPLARTAILEVRLSNQAAIRLYQSMGFEEYGIRKNYYPSAEGRETALILVKRL